MSDGGYHDGVLKLLALQQSQPKAFVELQEMRDVMEALLDAPLQLVDVDALTALYAQTKELPLRFWILRILYVYQTMPDLQAFFALAFKRERYLDMRMAAVRGYCLYAVEGEVLPLVDKVRVSLEKSSQRSPYDYHTLGLLRAQWCLPFLMQRYHYNCFARLFDLVETSYNAMPELYKRRCVSSDERGRFSYGI